MSQDNLEKLLPSLLVDKIRKSLPANEEKMSQARREKIEQDLNDLEEIEIFYNTIHKARQFEKEFIERIEEDEFWQDAKRIVEDIRYSAGYVAEIFFDKENKLISSYIEIRHSGKQARHITPVVLIERIISSSLQKGATPNEILIALRDKIEIFRPYYSEEDNDYIQKLFNYFNHPDFRNAYGISTLIKIVAHLYNENIFIAMNDDYIKIPYQTNSCYLLPISISGKKIKHHHKTEGSFIKELCKILNHFAIGLEESDEKTLAENEIEQMAYAIFAIFDYMPLPQNVKNPKDKEPNHEKHRYEGEEIERLYKIAANHLHFVFEAYPEFEKYRKEIFEKFLYYLTNGVSKDNLLSIFDCGNLEKLISKLELGMRTGDVRSNFTNEGQVRGFAKQYETKSEMFLKNLKGNMERLLTDRNRDYLYSIHPEIEPPETPASVAKKEKAKEHSRSYAIQYLYLVYFYDRSIKKDFNNLASNTQTILNIDSIKFRKKFKETVIKYFYDEKMQQNFLESTKEFLTKHSENFPGAKFDEFLSQIEKDDLHNFTKVIKLSIEDAYRSLITDNFELTQENLAILRNKVLELRANQRVRRRLTYSSRSSSGSEHVSEEGPSKSETETELEGPDETKQPQPSGFQSGPPPYDTPTRFFHGGSRIEDKDKNEKTATVESKTSGISKKRDSKQ